MYIEEREPLAPVVGTVFAGSPAESRLRPGDRIIAVGSTPITSFRDVSQLVAKSAGRTVRLSVVRDGKALDVSLVPRDEVGLVDPVARPEQARVGRLGISPLAPAPVIGIAQTDGPAYRAGLRTFDRVTSVNGRAISTFTELLGILAQNKSEHLVLSYMRPISSSRALGGLGEIAVMESRIASFTPKPQKAVARTPNPEFDQIADDVLIRTGIESAEMFVAHVPEGTPEWLAGLRRGDRVTHCDGIAINAWGVVRGQALAVDEATLIGRLSREPESLHELRWSRNGERMRGWLQVPHYRWADPYGHTHVRVAVRATHWAPSAPPSRVASERRLAAAVQRGMLHAATTLTFVWHVASEKTGLRAASAVASSSPPKLAADLVYEVEGQAGPVRAEWPLQHLVAASMIVTIVALLAAVGVAAWRFVPFVGRSADSLRPPQ